MRTARIPLAFLLLCLLCAPALCEESTSLPVQVETQLARHFPTAQILDYVHMKDDCGAKNALVLMENQGENTLIVYRFSEESWQCLFSVAAAIPQGKYDEIVACSMGVIPEGSPLFSHWDISGRRPLLSDGLWLEIRLEDTEKTVESVTFHWEKGALHLKKYQFGPGHYADIENGEILLSNIGNGDVERIRRTLNTHILTLDFYALPRYSLPEKLPPQLQLYPAVFEKDLRMPVYAGPGDHYPRSGNGKAVVSTNGPIRVLGEYSGYLLIHYEINDEKSRYGWVSQEGLEEGCTVPPIAFHEQRKETLAQSCSLTDDPLGSRAALLSLKKGTQVDWLSSLNEEWAYVRVQNGGNTWFGFVPISALEMSVG